MLSVIIPTYKTAPQLGALLEQIGPYAGDIIVSDTAHNPEIIKSALRAGARIALGRSGRGWQLARGASFSAAKDPQDWLLFLHADCRLPSDWTAIIEAHIDQYPQKAAYFAFKLNDAGFWPYFMEKMVALRCWALALPYGDQGLLIRRDHYEACGGHKNWDVFEDVQIVRAIVKAGGRSRLRNLGARLVTDASKYKRDGYWKRGFCNFGLLLRYLMGADVDVLAKAYR